MNKKLIKFKSFLPNLTNNFPIKKANIVNFDWFKKMVQDYKDNLPSVHTSKCPGIISVSCVGWVQYSYQDFIIKTNGDLINFEWSSELDQKSLMYGELLGDYISYHSKNQLNKFKPFPDNVLHTIIKIQSPWIVEIPEGYTLLSMPIPYSDDIRFTAATGLLKNKNWLNVQLFWNKINSEELIKKGTPLCQYILLKNDVLEHENSYINEEDLIFLKKIKNGTK